MSGVRIEDEQLSRQTGAGMANTTGWRTSMHNQRQHVADIGVQHATGVMNGPIAVPVKISARCRWE